MTSHVREMDAVSLALAEDVPLSIPRLADLGKGLLRRALVSISDEQDVSRITSLWPKLVQTAISPQVNNKHITAASNALCVYLSCCSASAISDLRQLALSQNAWFEAFNCAQKAFKDGKTKPAFQIVEVLCDLLQKLPDSSLVADTLEKATVPLVRIVLLGSPRSEVKKACLMLSCFHRRTPLSDFLDRTVLQCTKENHHLWRQRLAEHKILSSEIASAEEGSIIHLFLALIFAMVDLDTRSAALKLCTALSVDPNSETATMELHSVVELILRLYLDRNLAATGTFAENVLPVVLHTKEKLLSFIEPYAASCRANSSKMALFLAILKVGRGRAILSESGMRNSFCSPPAMSDS